MKDNLGYRKVINNTLHIIDDNFNPDPMTVKGTKDLVAMFYALQKANRKLDLSL